MSISKRAIDAFEWVQLGFWGAFAGITFGMALGWVVGVCVAGGFLALCALVARGMKSVASKSLQTSVPQRRFPQRNVP
jgi:hypothetical protein